MSELSLGGLGVAIIAPGGYAPDDEAALRGVEYLQSQGCRVYNYYNPEGKFQRFGGSDSARIAQVEAAVDNPNVKVVLALRGGYGMSRLLPRLDFFRFAASGKMFVGQSDFTAFHMGILKAGAISFAGPMICDDFTRPDHSEFTINNLWRCLAGPTHCVDVKQENPQVDVEGVLWGGNLTMLTHLIGSPFLPKIDDGIMFIEDVGEHPYRIERMILQMLYSGLLSRQKALLLGDFSNYRLSDYDNGYGFDAMLAYLRTIVPIPILTGLPFGHVRDKVTLPVGSRAQLVSDGKAWQLVMRGYPNL